LNIMTTTAAAPARRFSPIFVATVTPATIVEGTGKNEKPYALMQGATYATKSKPAKSVTVMAFGDQLAEVRDSLVSGQSVDLAVQFDGGTLRVVGHPRAKAAPANDADQAAVAA
jgi:hypothetical protein